MISFFNKIGNTWIAKAILVALGISMLAFWGIGGIGNTSNSDTTAIQVGSRKISVTDLAKTFELERAKLSQLTMQYISPKQAIEMGLLQQVIQKQVADALAMSIQQDLGLAASDEAVRKYVERHPVFQDSLGHFDRNLFLTYLNQTRLTEGQLAEQLRHELANQHLSNTIRFVSPASKILAQLQWQYQNQKRDVEALLIETDKIPVLARPTQEELKEYYEAYLSDFMLPETRDILLLNITPQIIAKNIHISQERISETYEAEKQQYVKPEQRHIYQMRFNTKETADTAKNGVTAQNFVEKASGIGQKISETDFGLVDRTQLLPELAEAAFNAKNNTVIGPIETPTGWHLLLVSEIQPATTPDVRKIHDEIKNRLISEEAYSKLDDTRREIENLLGEGLSVSQVSEKLNIPTQSFKNVDIAASNLPKELKNNDLMQDLFTLKEHEATALTEQGDGYLIAELQNIHPVQAKNFEDVQNELNSIWKSEKQKTALEDIVAKALKQMQNGSIPAKLGQIIVAKKISQTNPGKIPPAALTKVFTQESGYENATAITLPNGMLISVVKHIQTPSVDENVLPEQMEQISADNAEALRNAMIEKYAQKLGVQVHTEAIQRAFSVYQSE